MKELFDQMTKNMEKSWDQWQNLVSKAPWWQEPEALSMAKWSSWIATTRSTYEVNMSVWKSFVEQSERNFFKMFKKSPVWTENLEAQIRQLWDGLKQAQETQHDLMLKHWKKIEDLLRDTAE